MPKTVKVCSQEVGNDVAVVDDSGALRYRVENFKVVLHLLVNKHNGRNVSTAVAVVGRRPDSDQVGVLEPEFKAIHHQLMSSGNQVQVVNVIELRRDFRAEKPPSTAGRNSPGVDIVRVRPHQIAVSTLVRDLLPAFDEAYLVQSLNVGRETAVHTENFSLNNGADAE
jgi:hypothetical protein